MLPQLDRCCGASWGSLGLVWNPRSPWAMLLHGAERAAGAAPSPRSGGAAAQGDSRSPGMAEQQLGASPISLTQPPLHGSVEGR